MYSVKDLVWLCDRSSSAFWSILKGCACLGCGREDPVYPYKVMTPICSPQLCAWRLKNFQKALTAYAKLFHGNGKADKVQERAIEHIAGTEKRLSHAWMLTNCAPGKALNADGEKVGVCLKHGDKSKCLADFARWFKAQSY